MSDETSREIAPVPAAPAGSLLNFIAQAVSDPGVDVAKLRALLEIQRLVIEDDAKAQFNRALHAAQAEIPHISKTGRVELIDKAGKNLGSYAFATIEEMDRVLRPIMDRHGFTLTFDMAMREGGGAVITGTLLHAAGHSKSASIPLALDSGPGRNNLQAMGSTMSYGRRYLTEMLFNIIRKGADDDGKLGGMQFITAEQVAELEALMKETKSDEARFCEIMGVAHLATIPAGAWAAARNMLLSKRRPK